MKIMLLTGGQDPVHKGHVKMINAARVFVGVEGRVVIGLNSDVWLKRKKGYQFMKWDERKFILEHLFGVSCVFAFDDSDGSAVEAIRYMKKSFAADEYFFGNGGDRDPDNLPKKEIEVCKELGVEMVWGVGGSKIQSSSSLVEEENMNAARDKTCPECLIPVNPCSYELRIHYVNGKEAGREYYCDGC